MSTQAIALNGASRQRYLLTLLFAGFVLTGLEITLIGPMLPTFIQRWSLNDSQAGTLGAVQFGASLGGVWLSALLRHYLGPRIPLLLGYFCMFAGLATVNAPSMSIVFAALSCLGIGYGLVVPPTNLGVAQIGGARSASLVSLVNFAWSAGAVGCSPLILLASKLGLLRWFLLGFAAFGALLTLAVFFADFPAEQQEKSERAAVQEAPVSTFNTVALATLFFLYVGIEVSFSSWAAAHAARLSHQGADLATVAPMFFFAGLMTGRALAPLILARVREFPLVVSAITIVLAGNSLLVLAPRQSVAFVSLVLSGLGCSTIFPIYVAWLSRWYGKAANRISGWMFSMSSVGSAAVPPLVGIVSNALKQHGGLRVGLLVPAACAVAMLLLLLQVRRQASSE